MQFSLHYPARTFEGGGSAQVDPFQYLKGLFASCLFVACLVRLLSGGDRSVVFTGFQGVVPWIRAQFTLTATWLPDFYIYFDSLSGIPALHPKFLYCSIQLFNELSAARSKVRDMEGGDERKLAALSSA